VENAKLVAMERRSYKCSKTEMDVTEHCWKHTSSSNLRSVV